jgi:hypothetical protein
MKLWHYLTDEQQRLMLPKLAGKATEPIAAAMIEERFHALLAPCATQQEVADSLLTLENFIAGTGGYSDSPLWRQIAAFRGVRRSYLELLVHDRDTLLQVLAEQNYVINREPFWTIHKFDSARARTRYAHEPSLHFANDRADEDGYGPNYFFVHWDATSCWFEKSRWWVGARQLERLHAALQHWRGCACPQQVRAYLGGTR